MSAHELYADVPREPRALSPEATLHLALEVRTAERDAARAALAEALAELERLRTLTNHGAASAAPTTPGQGVSAPVTAGPVSLAGARPAAVNAGHPAHVPSAEALRWAEAVR